MNSEINFRVFLTIHFLLKQAGQVIQSYNDQIMIESCEIFTGLGKFTISSHKQQVSNGSNSALWENVRG